MLTTSWYAVKINNKYWLGFKSVDGTDNFYTLCPCMNGALLVPTNSDRETIDRLKELAEEHGGCIVELKLNMQSYLDEMLKTKIKE